MVNASIPQIRGREPSISQLLPSVCSISSMSNLIRQFPLIFMLITSRLMDVVTEVEMEGRLLETHLHMILVSTPPCQTQRPATVSIDLICNSSNSSTKISRSLNTSFLCVKLITP
ncbi:hypothetical protein GDO81_011018 [Engystomops pustulosus]|uniref:Uncharacterized protein n=1 Tax=Engystomops pustulosus TaxID=76066 RepID=A0AAV7C403_ENGPU|nr:hypothetical protein GDO81_011018 [Engystomops pustulosus]